MSLTRRESNALIYVLSKLPDFIVTEGRRALLESAGLERYVQRVNLQGAARIVASALIEQLKQHDEDLSLFLRNLLDSRDDIPNSHVSLIASLIIQHRLVNDPEGYREKLRIRYGQLLAVGDPSKWKDKGFEKYQSNFKVRHYIVIPTLLFMLVTVFFFLARFPGDLPFYLLSTRDSVIRFNQWIEKLFGIETTFSDEIRVVAFTTLQKIPTESERAYQRKRYAALIDKLSKAGAKIIAFDMYFKSSTPSDGKLIKSIEEAKGRGTFIIMGTNDSRGYTKIEEQLKKAGSEWATTCLGKVAGSIHKAPVAVLRKKEVEEVQAEQQIPIAEPYPLALKIFEIHRGIGKSNGDKKLKIKLSSEQGLGEELGFADLKIQWKSNQGIEKELEFSKLEESEEKIECNTDEGDRVAYIFFDFYPGLEARSPYFFEASNLLEGNMDLSVPFKNKIVLVGSQVKDCHSKDCDVHAVGGKKVYGLQLHANVLNALLKNEIIRPANEVYQLMILICFCISGVVFRYLLPERLGLMIFCSLLYLFSTLMIYAQYRIVLDIFYPISAFWLAYWIVPKLDVWLEKKTVLPKLDDKLEKQVQSIIKK